MVFGAYKVENALIKCGWVREPLPLGYCGNCNMIDPIDGKSYHLFTAQAIQSKRNIEAGKKAIPDRLAPDEDFE